MSNQLSVVFIERTAQDNVKTFYVQIHTIRYNLICKINLYNV